MNEREEMKKIYSEQQEGMRMKPSPSRTTAPAVARSAANVGDADSTVTCNPYHDFNPERTLGTPGVTELDRATTQRTRGLAHVPGPASSRTQSVVSGQIAGTRDVNGTGDQARRTLDESDVGQEEPGPLLSRAVAKNPRSSAPTLVAAQEDLNPANTVPAGSSARTQGRLSAGSRVSQAHANPENTGASDSLTENSHHSSPVAPRAPSHTDRKDRTGTDMESAQGLSPELRHTEAPSQLIPSGSNPTAQADKAGVDISGMTPSYGFFLKRLRRLHGGAISLELQNLMASSRHLQGGTQVAPDSDSASEDAALDSRFPRHCTSSSRSDGRLVTIRGEQDMGNRSPTGDSGGEKPEGNHSRRFRANMTPGQGQREGHRLNWERHPRMGSPPTTEAPGVPPKGQGEVKSTGRRGSPSGIPSQGYGDALNGTSVYAFTGSSGHGSRGRRMITQAHSPHGQRKKHEANTPKRDSAQNNNERAQTKKRTMNRTPDGRIGTNSRSSTASVREHLTQKRRKHNNASQLSTGSSPHLRGDDPRTINRRHNTCSYCKRPGHKAVNCRFNPASHKNTGMACRICGQPGHVQEDCRHNPIARANRILVRRPGANNQRSQAEQLQTHNREQKIRHTSQATAPTNLEQRHYTNEYIRGVQQGIYPVDYSIAHSPYRSGNYLHRPDLVCEYCNFRGHTEEECRRNPHGHNYRGRNRDAISRAHGQSLRQIHNPPTKTEICTRCHQPGHIVEHCTATLKLAKEERHTETVLTAPGPLQCYRCCRTGHTAENCTTRAIPLTASYQLKSDGQQARTQEYEHVGLVLETRDDNPDEERKSHTTTVDLGQESSGSSASRTEEGEEEVRITNPGQRTQRGQDGDDEQDIKPMLGPGERPYRPIFTDPNALRLNLSADQHRVYRMIAQLETALNRENNPLKRALNTRMERIETNIGTLTNRLNAQRDAILDLQTIVDLACTCVEELQFSTRTLPTDLAAQDNFGNYLFKKIREVYAQWGWPLPTGNSVFSQHSDNYSAQPPQRNMDAGNWELDEDGTPMEHMELGASASNVRFGDTGLNQHGGIHQEYDPLMDNAGAANVAREHNDQHQMVANANGTVNPNPNGDAQAMAQDGDGGDFDLRITRGGVLYAAPIDPRDPQGTAGGGQEQTAQLLQQPPQNHAQLRQQRGYANQELCGALGINSWNDTFEGRRGEDINRFLDSFDTFCELGKVQGTERAMLLWLRLKGYAQQVVEDIDRKGTSGYDQMRIRLQKAFGGADQTHTAKSSIEDMRYTTDTVYNDFVGRLMVLLKKAYPKDIETTRDTRAFDILMTKFPHAMRVEMLRNKVENIDDLNRAAPAIEAIVREKRRFGQNPTARPVTATFLDQEETNVGIVGTDYAAPNAPHPYKGDQVTPARNKQGRRTQPQAQPRGGGRPQSFNYTRGQGWNNQQATRPNRPVQGQGQAINCAFCGKPGHMMMKCRLYIASQGQPGNQGGRTPQGNRPQQTSTVQQPRINRQPPTCYTCGHLGHVARYCPFGQPQRGQYGQNPMEQLQGQFQQLRLQQAPQQQQMLRRQPYQTAAIMLPQQQQMDMPHQSTSAPMVLKPGQQYTQQAQMQQQQQQLYPQQQQVQPTVMVPPSTSTNMGNTNAIAQATGTENDTAQAEDEASAKKLTEEDIKEMKGTMRLLTSKLYLKADQESPSLDILATLTRHENGHEPEFIPVDYRLVTIPVIVHGHECTALFDSGSSITIAPIALAEILGIKVEDSDKSIKSVTGHVASANKRGLVRLTMAGHTRDVEIHFTGNFLGTKNPYDLIIGVDTMRHFPSVTLNVQERKMTIGHNTLCWKTKGELLREERKVFVTHELVVPPNTQAVVGAFIDNSKGEVTPTVTIEKTGTNPIEVVCSLTDVDADNRCKLVICNPHKVPITIRPFEVIGLAANTIEDNGDIGNIPEITAAMAQGFKRAQDIDPTYVVDYSKTDCTEGQQVQLRKLLEKYGNAFSKNGYDLGTARVNPMQIRTTTDVPFRPSIYPTDRGIRDKVRQELEHMKDQCRHQWRGYREHTLDQHRKELRAHKRWLGYRRQPSQRFNRWRGYRKRYNRNLTWDSILHTLGRECGTTFGERNITTRDVSTQSCTFCPTPSTKTSRNVMFSVEVGRIEDLKDDVPNFQKFSRTSFPGYAIAHLLLSQPLSIPQEELRHRRRRKKKSKMIVEGKKQQNEKDKVACLRAQSTNDSGSQKGSSTKSVFDRLQERAQHGAEPQKHTKKPQGNTDFRAMRDAARAKRLVMFGQTPFEHIPTPAQVKKKEAKDKKAEHFRKTKTRGGQDRRFQPTQNKKKTELALVDKQVAYIEGTTGATNPLKEPLALKDDAHFPTLGEPRLDLKYERIKDWAAACAPKSSTQTPTPVEKSDKQQTTDTQVSEIKAHTDDEKLPPSEAGGENILMASNPQPSSTEIVRHEEAENQSPPKGTDKDIQVASNPQPPSTEEGPSQHTAQQAPDERLSTTMEQLSLRGSASHKSTTVEYQGRFMEEDDLRNLFPVVYNYRQGKKALDRQTAFMIQNWGSIEEVSNWHSRNLLGFNNMALWPSNLHTFMATSHEDTIIRFAAATDSFRRYEINTKYESTIAGDLIASMDKERDTCEWAVMTFFERIVMNPKLAQSMTPQEVMDFNSAQIFIQMCVGVLPGMLALAQTYIRNSDFCSLKHMSHHTAQILTMRLQEFPDYGTIAEMHRTLDEYNRLGMYRMTQFKDRSEAYHEYLQTQAQASASQRSHSTATEQAAPTHVGQPMSPTHHEQQPMAAAPATAHQQPPVREQARTKPSSAQGKGEGTPNPAKGVGNPSTAPAGGQRSGSESTHGGAGGGKKPPGDNDPPASAEAQQDKKRMLQLLRTKTNRTTFWNGDETWEEDYAVLIYKHRRAEAFGEHMVPLDRIPDNIRAEVIKAYDTVYGKTFYPMRSNLQGHLVSCKDILTTTLELDDSHVLTMPTDKQKHNPDGTPAGYCTFMDIEERARKERTDRRDGIPRFQRGRVSEAYDRHKFRFRNRAPSEAPTGMSQSTKASAYELLTDRELLNELASGTYYLDIGKSRLTMAQAQCLINKKTGRPLHEEFRHLVDAAYNRVYDHRTDDDVYKELFAQPVRPRGPPPDKPMEDKEFRRTGRELALLATRTGYSISIGLFRTADETYAMNIWNAMHDGGEYHFPDESTRLRAEAAYVEHYGHATKSEIRAHLFENNVLPTRAWAWARDTVLLKKETGRQIMYEDKLIQQTYAMVLFEHVRHNASMEDIDEKDRESAKEAMYRLFYSLDANFVKRLVFEDSNWTQLKDLHKVGQARKVWPSTFFGGEQSAAATEESASARDVNMASDDGQGEGEETLGLRQMVDETNIFEEDNPERRANRKPSVSYSSSSSTGTGKRGTSEDEPENEQPTDKPQDEDPIEHMEVDASKEVAPAPLTAAQATFLEPLLGVVEGGAYNPAAMEVDEASSEQAKEGQTETAQPQEPAPMEIKILGTPAGGGDKPPQQHPYCQACRGRHPLGQCPRAKQTASALGRSLSTLTGLQGQPPRTAQRAPSMASSRGARGYAPQVEERGLGTSRTPSVAGQRQQKGLESALNGVDKHSALAGKRMVRYELMRPLSSTITSFAHPRQYRIVKASVSFAIGYLDKSLPANTDMHEDNDAPLFLQFGDRYRPIELRFITGEIQEVISYQYAYNGRRHTSTTPITDLMDAAGNIATDAIATRYNMKAPSPMGIVDCYARSTDIRTKKDANHLESWEMNVFHMHSTEPANARNRHISYKTPPVADNWVWLDGYIVDKKTPQWVLGGCVFPTQVTAQATQAQAGFYLVRVRDGSQGAFVRDFNPAWTEHVSNFGTCRASHERSVQLYGAVSSLELQHKRDRASLSRVALKKPTKRSNFVYRFGMDTADKNKDQLREINGLRAMVRIFSVEKNADGQSIERHVMYGIVEKLAFHENLPHAITVRLFLRQEHIDRDTRALDEEPVEIDALTDNTRHIQKLIEELKKMKISDQLKDTFFDKFVKDKDLFLEKIPLSASDISAHKQYKFLHNTLGNVKGRFNRIMGTFNGIDFPQYSTNFTQLIAREQNKQQRDYYAYNQAFGKKVLAMKNMSKEHKDIIKAVVADDVPLSLIHAYAGTGKTTVLASIVGTELHRARETGRYDHTKIVIMSPSNKSACEVVDKLAQLLDSKAIFQEEVLLIQSTTNLQEGVDDIALPFTMYSHAKRLLEKANLPTLIRDILTGFRALVVSKCNVDYDIGTVIAAILRFGKVKCISCTADMARTHFPIREKATMVIGDEGGRLHDDSTRATIARMPQVKKVVIAGDICQLGPHNFWLDNSFIKYGKESVLQVAIKRQLAPVFRLTVSLRSIESLVRPLRAMTIEYGDIKSGLPDPDWDGDDYVRLPPLPIKDCTTVLLHVPSKHGRDKSGSVVNRAHEKVATDLVIILDECRKILGTDAKQNTMVVSSYQGVKSNIENRVRDIPFTDNGGVVTAEGSQSGGADRVIWVTGRTRPSATNDDGFAVDNKRAMTALSRPGIVVYVIGEFNYLTNTDNWLRNYVTAAVEDTPILDGIEYIKMLRTWIEQGKAQLEQGRPQLRFYRYGCGVLKKHLTTGQNEEDFSHIAPARPNDIAGWRDKRLYVPPAQIEGGYQPPPVIPLDTPLEDLADLDLGGLGLN